MSAKQVLEPRGLHGRVIGQLPARGAEVEVTARASGGGGEFGGGEDGGVVVVFVLRAAVGGVGAALGGGVGVGVAAERFAFVNSFAHLIEEILLLRYGRFSELRDLADGIAQAAFHAHGSLGEATAEGRLLDWRVVAEFVGVLRCLEFLALDLGAHVVFNGEEVAAHVFPALLWRCAEALRGVRRTCLVAGGCGSVRVESAIIRSAGHA